MFETVKATKLSYYGHTVRKQGSCLEKEIMQGAMPGARRRGRPRTAWMDNIKTWTGLSVEESIRMTEDRDKWRKYVHGVARPTLGSRTTKEQNRTSLVSDSVSSVPRQERDGECSSVGQDEMSGLGPGTFCGDLVVQNFDLWPNLQNILRFIVRLS